MLNPNTRFPLTRRRIEDLTRREFMSSALGAALLIACGDDGDDDTSGKTPTSSPTTRIVDSVHGPVEIPMSPVTVLCVDTVTPMPLLDVGFAPAGIINALMDGVSGLEHKEAFAEIPEIGGWLELDYELIVSMKPDLILGTELIDQEYERLSEIAPTLFIKNPTGDEWKTFSETLADVVGRAEEAKALRAAYDERVAALKAQFGEVLGRAKWSNIWTYGDGEWYAFIDSNPSSAVMQEAGVVLGDEAFASEAATYSMEQLNLLEASGVILVYDAASVNGSVSPETQEMFDLPAWQKLPAVQAGHVFTHASSATHYKAAMTLLDFVETVASELR